MIETKTTMTLTYLNDFYFLESLKAEIASLRATDPRLEFQHSVEKLREDIQETCNELYPNLALRIFMYLYAACLGEARHAANARAKDLYLTQITEDNRGEVFEKVTDFPPTKENIGKVITVFDQEWSGSFGGSAWLNIAKALKMYLEVPPSTFIDHVVDLQHNCGTVFSKNESKYAILFDITYKGGFKDFLDYKFQANMLRDHPGQHLLVTRKIKKLLERFQVIFRANEISWAKPTLLPLDKYVVQWGSENLSLTQKWAKWAHCTNGNLPNIRWLLYHQTRHTKPYKMLRTDLQKEVVKLEKSGKKLLSAFGKQYHEAWEKAVEKYYTEWKGKVKPTKLPVTYTQVPLKIKSLSIYQIEIQFLAPYFGYGTKTDYGFVYQGVSHGIYPSTQDLTEGFDGTPGYLDGVLTLNRDHPTIFAGGYTWNWEKKLEVLLS